MPTSPCAAVVVKCHALALAGLSQGEKTATCCWHCGKLQHADMASTWKFLLLKGGRGERGGKEREKSKAEAKYILMKYETMTTYRRHNLG